ncbi:hypothetical protein K443DRAFT_687198 [Laccaria amethystina LaAM-08-1]|uniref:DUF6534 domain-containing protein n=1 Tax=Laccaria amethystina LaAM-08-1 TaxID=1095629 RepID=A0A0C9WKN6_9AGAR|nr:hypothetical protein K443DRAFT_687198 [Laccaria amethystina LaAM-08-1]
MAAQVTVFRTAPLLIGTIITWFLSGSLTVQTHYYFYADRSVDDDMYIKVLVWVAFVVDHVRSMAVTASAWQSLVVAWGNPSNFIGTVTFPLMTVPLTGLESCLVQAFFSWRIWTLRKDSKVYRLITVAILLVGLLQLSAAIVRGVVCVQPPSTARRPYNMEITAKLWLAGTLICDLIIVATMTCLLFQAKLESTFSATKRVVDRLIIVTLETGAVTLTATLIQLIFYFKYPSNSLQQVGVMYILGGLYSNVLLRVLNGRKRARGRLAETSHNFSLHFTDQSLPPPLSSSSYQDGLESR